TSAFHGDVKISLFHEGIEVEAITSSAPGDGIIEWQPDPSLEAGQGFTVRVINANNEIEFGSSQEFSVIEGEGTAELTSPDGGELIEQAEPLAISWIGTGSPQEISIDLYSGNTLIGNIASGINSQESYTWTVPDTLEGNNYFIEISTPGGLKDRNDNPFSIVKDRIEFQTPDLPALDDSHSHARIWIEMLLESIRNDFARPTVHARNLFHVSAAMYDAWAAFDEDSRTYFLGNSIAGFDFPFEGIPSPINIKRSQEEALSYAAYRIMKHRFRNSPGAPDILDQMDILFNYLGYDRTNTSTDYTALNLVCRTARMRKIITKMSITSPSTLLYMPLNPGRAD
ncbi:MAG: GPI anchored serine-threonine rich family protein, partial [Cyclobacteriaceae bacterium]